MIAKCEMRNAQCKLGHAFCILHIGLSHYGVL